MKSFNTQLHSNALQHSIWGTLNLAFHEVSTLYLAFQAATQNFADCGCLKKVMTVTMGNCVRTCLS